MDERRRYKHARDEQGKSQCKRLRIEVQRRCRKARNNWIEGKCKEVESLFKIGKVDAARRKIRETFKERRNNANIVRDENGKTLTENRDKVSTWVEYTETLYMEDVHDLIENENEEVQNYEREDSIIKQEFEKALRGLKANKLQE